MELRVLWDEVGRDVRRVLELLGLQYGRRRRDGGILGFGSDRGFGGDWFGGNRVFGRGANLGDFFGRILGRELRWGTGSLWRSGGSRRLLARKTNLWEFVGDNFEIPIIIIIPYWLLTGVFKVDHL